MYNLVHDGTFKHPVMGNSVGEKMIAGQAHVDMPFHELRCALALDNINDDNGPTIVFRKSMNIRQNILLR